MSGHFATNKIANLIHDNNEFALKLQTVLALAKTAVKIKSYLWRRDDNQQNKQGSGNSPLHFIQLIT